ncbi:MAG: patatin-like phospholipase family protein [Ilumatobacteraceae bacterium]
MSTAIVLSGGANLGAVHVGMLRALIEHRVTPDLIVGTSVGALNGGYVSSRWTPAGVAGLDDVWTALRRSEVFPTRLFGGLLGFIGRSDHLVSNDPLRNLVRTQLQFDRLEQAPIPMHVIATDLLTGIDRRFSAGPADEAILASSAIPAIFPPVVIDGIPYVDGGVVDNTPISHAADLGASTIWVLPAGTACGLAEAPTSALAIALQAVSVLINRRLQRDIERLQGHCDVRVLPPLCPVTVSPTDFGQARQLIDRAYHRSMAALDSPDMAHVWRSDAAGVLDHPHQQVDAG